MSCKFCGVRIRGDDVCCAALAESIYQRRCQHAAMKRKRAEFMEFLERKKAEMCTNSRCGSCALCSWMDTEAEKATARWVNSKSQHNGWGALSEGATLHACAPYI